MKVYFISGLAADGRVFKYIQLPAGYDAIYMDWISPQKKESLRHYAERLANKINLNEPFILIGLSFGGMLASEIARHVHPEKTILIASIPVSSELPGYYRVLSTLQFHKIIPVSLLKSASIAKRIFAAELPEDKQLLYQIIKASDPKFIRWAIGAILEWENEDKPASLVHIHGTRDELLPLRYTHPTHIIQKAGHLLVMSRAEEVNTILKNSFVSLKNS